MKSLRLLFVLLFVLSVSVLVTHATCDQPPELPSDTGTAGNDTIICDVGSPPVGNVQGLDGDDTITIGAGVTTGTVSGGNTAAAAESGNDTIISDGNVTNIYGDSVNGLGSGSDTIINNGTSNIISGDSVNVDGSGNDVIINNGTVNTTIFGDSLGGNGSGNDIITNNGTVTSEIIGDSFFDGTGNDTITNNGNAGTITGDGTSGSGSDTIINNGYTDLIFGDGAASGSGNDTIINNGTVTYDIYADDDIFSTGTGNNTVVNNGSVGGNVITEAGTDSITNSGSINGYISAGSGSDTVTIEGNNATVGGIIDGGADYDILTFNLSSTDPEQMQAWAAEIALANPNGGTLTLNGHVYVWTNFEELTQLVFNLTRLNGVSDPIAVYCHLGGGIDVYTIADDQGTFAFNVSAQALSNSMAVASDDGIQVGSSEGVSAYIFGTDEVQVNTLDGFSFSFSYSSYCGALPEAQPVAVEEIEEELPPFSIINQPYGG